VSSKVVRHNRSGSELKVKSLISLIYMVAAEVMVTKTKNI